MESPSGDLGGGAREGNGRAIVITGFATILLLPLTSVFFSLCPILLLAWRQGIGAGLKSLGLVWLGGAALFGAFAGVQGVGAVYQGASQLLVFSFLALVFGGGLIAGRGVTRAGVMAVLPVVLLLTLFLGVSARVDPVGLETRWNEVMQQTVHATFEEIRQELGRTGGADDEMLEAWDEQRTWFKENQRWFLYLLPSLIGSAILAALWTNLLLVKTLEPGFGGAERLSDWRPPEWWFWGLVLGAALVLTRLETLMAVGLNLLVLGGEVYALAGLAIVAFWLRRVGLSPMTMLAGGLLLSLLTGMMFAVLFGLSCVGLGVVDFWLDLRRRFHQESGPEPGDEL